VFPSLHVPEDVSRRPRSAFEGGALERQLLLLLDAKFIRPSICVEMIQELSTKETFSVIEDRDDAERQLVLDSRAPFSWFEVRNKNKKSVSPPAHRSWLKLRQRATAQWSLRSTRRRIIVNFAGALVKRHHVKRETDRQRPGHHPKEIRKALRMQTGDYLAFSVCDDGTVLVAVQSVSLRWLRGIVGMRRKGVSVERMNQAVRRCARGDNE
jgi:bifunctional DNA-binding transcriptional regulator/antitoxin component of YhaV-PrlF toxin-antitoxin module